MADRVREDWLDGAHRTGDSVEIGNSVFCAGCGKFGGIFSIMIPEGYDPPPNPAPVWPFDEETCPVHVKETPATPTTAERVASRGPLP